jgi:hypothetical protein
MPEYIGEVPHIHILTTLTQDKMLLLGRRQVLDVLHAPERSMIIPFVGFKTRR